MNDEFLSMIQREVDANPAILGDLLNLVSDNWQRMQEAERAKRESSHLHALSAMLDNLYLVRLYGKKKPTLFNSMECCTMLDALDAVCPTSDYASKAQKDLRQHAARSFRALGWAPNDNFVSRVRGKSELIRNLYEEFPEEQAS